MTFNERTHITPYNTLELSTVYFILCIPIISVQYCTIPIATENLSQLQNGAGAEVNLEKITTGINALACMRLSVFEHVCTEVTAVASWHLGSFSNRKIS